ncbi:MAG: ABC transporter permease, partial [Hyphomicrobiales bacterium]|nr:ABC transporter permease [Hyphomicrobiales bacterium]
MNGTLTWRGWLLDPAPASRRQARFGRWFRAWLAFRRNGLAMTGLVVVSALVLTALAAPLIADPRAAILQVLAERLQPPSSSHWFGVDELGRDIFARIVFGARTTLIIVALVSAIVTPVGLAIGLTAGYFGHWIDAVLMRITDIFLSFPRLVLALAFAAALGPGIENAVIAIALTTWPPYARLARAETLTRRRAEFIEAAELQGASHLRIILSQIMPLCLP